MDIQEIHENLFETVLDESELQPVFITASESVESRLLGKGMPAVRQLISQDLMQSLNSDRSGYIDQLRQRFSDFEDTAFFILRAEEGPRRWLPERLRESFPKLDLPAILLKVGVEEAPAGSWIWTVLPEGILLDHRHSDFRKLLVEKADVRLVLTHDPSMEMFSDRFALEECAILCLKVSEELSQPTRFFEVPDVRGTKDDIVGDFERLWKQGGGETQFGFVHRGQLKPDDGLHSDVYNPRRQEAIAEIQEVGQTVPLSELVEFHCARNTSWSESAEPSDESRVIPYQAVDREVISKDDLRTPAEVYGTVTLKEGDLCIPRSLHHEPEEGFPVLQISEEMSDWHNQLAADENVVVLRPKGSNEPEDNAILYSYLQSPWAVELFIRRSASNKMVQLTQATMAELPVPRASDTVRTAWRGLRRTKEVFQSWQDEINSATNQLFESASLGESAKNLLSAGERLRQRKDAGQRVEELSYRVRTQFPYPLAYRWRKAETRNPETLSGFKDVLEAAEATICFLACVAIVSVRKTDESLRSVEEIGSQLQSSNRGTTFGHWLTILNEANSGRVRRANGSPACPDVFGCLRSNRMEEAIERLKTMRNDNAHGRGPSKSEVATYYNRAFKALKALYDEIDFLTQYELRYIKLPKPDSIEQVTDYRYRALTGDHPLTGLSSAQTKQAELETESLYLTDRNGELHLLRPLLTRHNCPECSRHATFYLDSFNPSSGSCELKSLEHGHVQTESAIAKAFRHVGLIPSNN